ncbi:MAG: regulatory protein RecX [Rhodospirillales bacterium]|nr:regulatory protein RecX [Alphaproteobacteria bacterium]MCB9981360.1 regulatory protein RecX [Rhodospirillales bacterium]
MSQNRASKVKIKPQNNRRKRPKKITETYLHNAGLYYLERYASSAANFRAVMLRKVKRSCMTHKDQNYTQCSALVDQLVEKFIHAGLLDDAVYTRAMVTSLRRRGKSTRAIHSALRAKGLNADQIEQTLTTIDQQTHNNETEAERHAALIFARKKRLGPWRGDREIDFQKELSRMARAGFSCDTSRSVLEINEDDAPFA